MVHPRLFGRSEHGSLRTFTYEFTKVAMPALLHGELTALRTSVCRTAARFDVAELDLEGAVESLQMWSAIAHAAEAAAAMAAARIGECGPPASAGARDAAEYVAKTMGTTTARAKDRIQTGSRIRATAKTRAKAAEGALSPEQIAVIADAVDADPSAEDELLRAANSDSLGELRDRCANAKAAVTDVAEQERQIHARRAVRRYTDREGAEHLHAVGTKRDMALVDQALRPYVEQRFERARNDGMREPLDAYTFDALIDLVRDALDGSAAPGPKTKDPIRHLGVLRIDWEALLRGWVEPDETCEIAGLGPISVSAARDLLGESILKLVITKGVDVINVTHLGRGPNTAQKIALLWQMPGCSREGCGRQARLQYDHRDEWRSVRCTEIANLDP